MYGHEIAIEDAGVLHGHAGDLEEVVRLGGEDVRIDVESRFDVLFCENRLASGHTADERQPELLAQDVLQLDTARGARHERDDALAGEGAQVFLGGIGRTETQLLCDLRAGGGHTGLGDSTLNETEDFGLAGGQV